MDGTVRTRAESVAKGNDDLGISYKGWQYATPGPTAVWATENTRAGIFDALERREVYSTTGPRFTVRFFGGRLRQTMSSTVIWRASGIRKVFPWDRI